MRKVIWTDNNGFKHVSLLRDTDSDSNPKIGIPLDPPPIGELLPDLARDLHNELVDRGLLTWEDIMRSQDGLTAVITRTIKHKLIDYYRLQATLQTTRRTT